MTANHLHKLLEALVERTPFRPFTIELVGGHRFEVDHSRAIIERDGAAVFMALGGVPIWFDHESIVTIVGDNANSSA